MVYVLWEYHLDTVAQEYHSTPIVEISLKLCTVMRSVRQWLWDRQGSKIELVYLALDLEQQSKMGGRNADMFSIVLTTGIVSSAVGINTGDWSTIGLCLITWKIFKYRIGVGKKTKYTGIYGWSSSSGSLLICTSKNEEFDLNFILSIAYTNINSSYNRINWNTYCS